MTAEIIDRKDIGLRPMTKADEEFLIALYASTRAHEMAMVNWSDQQKSDFILMQFKAQSSHYQKAFSNASYDLILYKETAIGRLYLDKGENDFLIIDIALLPEYCNRGIGSKLLQEILDDAQSVGLPVKIHVEKDNPALKLYHRLGFTPLEDKTPYWLMIWQPEPATV